MRVLGDRPSFLLVVNQQNRNKTSIMAKQHNTLQGVSSMIPYRMSYPITGFLSDVISDNRVIVGYHVR